MNRKLHSKFLLVIPVASMAILPIVGCATNKKADDVVHVNSIKIKCYETDETEIYDKGIKYNYAVIGDEPNKIDVEIEPKNATNKNIIWESGDKDIVEFDQEGNVLAKEEGTTTIKAISEDGSKTDEIYFFVVRNITSADKISINDMEQISPIDVGKTIELNAKVEPESAIQFVNWESTVPSVATIEPSPWEYTKGIISALKPGETTIKAETYDGSCKCSFKLIVKDPETPSEPVENIDLFPAEAEKGINLDIDNESKKTTKLGATVLPSGATKGVNWYIEDPKIATFEEYSGINMIKITAKKIGKTNLIVTTKGLDIHGKIIQKVIPITVTGKNIVYVDKISINEKNKDGSIPLVMNQPPKLLTYTFDPIEPTITDVELVSENPNIVKVDRGHIIPVAPGETTITAKALGSAQGKTVTDTCKVNVSSATIYNKIILETDGHGDINKKEILVKKGTPFKQALLDNDVEIILEDFYQFTHWSNNGKPITDDFTVENDFKATANFVEVPKLRITNDADLRIYEEGEYFDPIGLQITAKYKDKPEKILGKNEWTASIQYNSKLDKVGDFDVTITLNDNQWAKTSYKINVVKKADVVAENITQKFGDITVKYKLMSNHECVLTGYESGEGILSIPDYVLHSGNKYYIKRIPNNWSNDQNNIRGFDFHGLPTEDSTDTQVQHLKVIESKAFFGTNALDYWVDNYGKIVKFPEGLIEIGDNAFSGTFMSEAHIAGYDFPSTIRKIGNQAFGNCAPIIVGDNEVSKLIFRCPTDLVNIHTTAFDCSSKHKVNVVCGPTQLDAKDWVWCFSNPLSNSFERGAQLLIPVPITCKVKIEVGEHGQVIKDVIEIPGGTTWEEAKSEVEKAVKPQDGFHFRQCQTEDGTVLNNSFIFTQDLTLKVIFSKNTGIESISLTNLPDLHTYEKGEYFDPIGATITAKYSNGDTRTLDRSEWTTNIEYNSKLETAGNQTVTISLIEEPDITTTYPITVINEATEVAESNNTAFFGDICVKFKLMSNQECVLTDYVSGKGNLLIPDYVVRQGKKWYIKKIPYNWSNGEDKITGFDFHGKASGGDETITEVAHLKVIEEHAFEGTNVFDHWIEHNEVWLKFPEGLVEIGFRAFAETDHSIGNHVRGYEFPSTIRKIDELAIAASTPWIDGDKNNESKLIFKCPKSLVDIHPSAFDNSSGKHETKAIYAPTYLMAHEWARFLSNTGSFKTDGYLVPKALPKALK